LKQFATPIISSTSQIAVADKAIADAYKAADKTLGDAATAIDTAYKAADVVLRDAIAVITNQSILVTMSPPAGVGTNMLCNYDNGVMSVASCSGANAKPANCFVTTHSGATTNFYRADFVVGATWIPTGSIKGRMLFLGVDGAFSLNEPANTQGNIIQKVSLVLADGTGLIDIKEPIFVGA
jgi:hypothetical protein